MMDNAEEIMHSLEEFSKLKPKVIPRELEDYLGYVAKTGDPVFKWSMVKFLFREKMLSVINDFYEDTLTIDLPPCPNVDIFNYDRMKTSLLERLESFHGAPFTVQRICELLTNPRKEYNRADKFMRAIEKNILVVSTREPGRYSDLDCENTQECSINGIREGSDSLDSTFIINDLGPGPDSSSPNPELNDNLPDANHLNTVARVSPVHDQDVSSDSDDSSLENCRVSADEPSEKVNGIENENAMDESDGANVSSTDMSSLSANNSDEISGDESVENIGNPVTSTHGNILDQQTGTLGADHDLGEVDAAEQAQEVEPCNVSEATVLNEVLSEPEANSVAEVDHSDNNPVVSKSDSSEDSSVTKQEEVDRQTVDTNAISSIEAVECDTSQSDGNIKHDDADINSASTSVASTLPSCPMPSDTNEQIAACDTTECNSELTGFHLESGDTQTVQSDVSQSENISEPDNMSQCEAVAHSDTESDTTDQTSIAQSDIVAQSDAPVSDLVQSEPEQSNSIAQSDEAQSDVIAQSDEIQSDLAQCDEIAQSDVAQSDIIDQSDDIAQSDLVAQSDVIAQSDMVAQSSIIGESCIAQSGVIAQSDDAAHSEPMAQSSIIDQSECREPEESQSEIPDQSEQVVLMEIPSDSESTAMEPAQSDLPDCVSSEPMDVDE